MGEYGIIPGIPLEAHWCPRITELYDKGDEDQVRVFKHKMDISGWYVAINQVIVPIRFCPMCGIKLLSDVERERQEASKGSRDYR